MIFSGLQFVNALLCKKFRPGIKFPTIDSAGVIGIKLLNAKPSLHVHHDQASITFRQYSYMPRINVSVTM